MVDDAQWLDRASAQVLAFVARRLLAEPVGLLFAAREPGDGAARGCRSSRSSGLRDGDARALLGSVVRGRLDERVRDRIVAETRGNPLALLELPRGLTRDAAGGRVRAAAARRRCPGGSRRASVRRLEALPPTTQRLAAGRGGRAGRRPAAGVARGRAARASRPRRRLAAEADGLLEIGDRVTVPPSAGALGGLPVGVAARSAGRCTWRWPRSTDPGRRPRPPRLASRRRRRRARRGGRRRARALGRPGAGARRARRRGRVPAALGRADARPGPAGGARAGRGAGRACRPARSSAALGLLADGGGRAARRAPARPGRPAARADRVRLRAAAATRRRCCSRPPSGSSRSTSSSRARPTSTRWGAALFAGRLASAGSLLEVSARRAGRSRPARPAASVRPAAGRPGAAGHRRTRRGGARAATGDERASPPTTSPRRTTSAGAGWPRCRRNVLWDDESWHAIRPPGRSSPATRARSPGCRST